MVTTAKRATKKTKFWLLRWQDFLLWMPLAGALLFFVWAALDKIKDPSDRVKMLIEFAVLMLYALAPIAVAFLARRRQRKHLTEEQEADLWKRLMDGERGACVVYITDTVVWLSAYLPAVAFFWVYR